MHRIVNYVHALPASQLNFYCDRATATRSYTLHFSASHRMKTKVMPRQSFACSTAWRKLHSNPAESVTFCA